jgi:hypothetical protein
MSEEARAQRLWRQIIEARSAAELRDLVTEIDRLEPEAAAEDHLDYLRGQAILGLLEFSRDNLDEARHIILTELLPLCLREDWPRHWQGWRYNEILRNWLWQLPAADRASLREPILAACMADLLSGRRARRAAALATTLGYRSGPLVDALADLVAKHDDEFGDLALQARIELGVTEEDRPQLLTELNRRIATGRWNDSLVGAALKLASPESLDFVFDFWLTRPNLVSEQAQLRALSEVTLQVPPAVADRARGNAGLQDAVWRRLLNLRDYNQALLGRLLSLNGRFGQLFDSPEVIGTYLGLLDDEHPVVRERAYHRLAECVRPRHLEGWACTPPEAVRRKLDEDAFSPSGMEGEWATINLHCKQDAWQTLLCLGAREALGRLDEVLDAEANGFAMAEVLKVASCFPIRPLPRRVPQLIAARFGSIPETGNQRILAQVTAIQLARGAASEEALVALLDYKRFHTTGVLIGLVDALADTVEALVRSGNLSALKTLLAVARPHPGANHDQRSASGAALARLVRRKVVPDVPASEILALANDPGLHPFPRRQLLDALAYLPPGALDPGTLDLLRGVARGTVSLAGDEGGGGEYERWEAVALRVLARYGYLADDEGMLGECLGLELDGAGWQLAERRRRGAEEAYVLGLLYAGHPTSFAPAIAGLLKIGDWPVVARLVAPLRDTRPVSPVVIDALVERSARARDGRMAEPDLLGLLAAVAPERLASEDWPELRDWPPPARSALANALGAAGELSGEPQRRRLQHLAVLMEDGQYGVRRAAYRAMAAVAPRELEGLCLTWGCLAGPSAVELRQRAAEGIAWCRPGDAFRQLAALESDPEPSVREAFERCSGERSEREWAASCLERVQAVRDGDGVLAAWRYARALERLGDDWVLQELEQRQREEGLPPAVRYWLDRLSDHVRKRWEEVTRQWPGPWFARQGAIENVRGAIRLRDGTAVNFDGWLWHEVAAEPTSITSWGGWAEQAILPLINQQNFELALVLEGRRPARILVTSLHLPQGHVSFSGTGPFPEPA